MVKVLNRDKIQRMVDYTGGAGTQSSSGGGGEGVSQAWVNANFVSIAYFEQLFKAYKPAEQSGDPDVEVKPNTIDEDISNIKAMKGFWTEQYISALGQGSGGGGGGGASALTDLVDVSISSPSSGQVLMYDGNGHWINGSISMSGYATQAWVQQQGYATQTWVGNNYLGLHATADAAAKLATARTLWGQSFDGTGNVSGDMSGVGDIALGNGKHIYNAAKGSGGSLYIGRSDDGGWVYISDMCSRQGSTYWNVTSAGNATFANVLSNGYVTALSDIRKKNVIEDIELDVNAIALARLIRFTWKDGFDKNEHVGGIAQEWQKILPEAVHEAADGTLSMDYGAIGVISAVTLARKVVEQERRLDQLEARIKILKKIL